MAQQRDYIEEEVAMTVKRAHARARVCVAPKYFNQINSVHYKHHHSTALSAPQQCLDNLPPFLPLSTTQRLCTVFHAPTETCSPACPYADPCARAPDRASL